ncbi:MAG: hypothetical protein VYC03_04855 [Pseudomonadota bacterium]|nr:hypothetical protein [Pseudomonadota bacterium]
MAIAGRYYHLETEGIPPSTTKLTPLIHDDSALNSLYEDWSTKQHAQFFSQ